MARPFFLAVLLAAPLAAGATPPEHPPHPPVVKPGIVQPAPVKPGPVKPGPVKPGPVKPGPVKPGPVKPGPVKPGPVKPGPVKPGPAKPVAVKPASAKPNSAHLAPPPAPVAVLAPPPVEAPAKGSNTGLPLPRFASLKTGEVNLRTGPGTRYPIEWVYKRLDLPVQIEREFEVWRLVTDPEGTKGWVHQATLAGRRTFVVKEPERTLREDAKPDAGAVARLQPGVIGRIRSCAADADWCQVQVSDYRGWLPRDSLWGIYPKEAIQ